MLQASPNLSPDTVKARLMVSADKWAAPDAKGNPTGQADPCTYGAGYLDIPAALKNTLVATSPALSPSLIQDSKGNVSINASGITSASHIIWGTGTVNDLHIIWGTSAILGTSTSAVGLPHHLGHQRLRRPHHLGHQHQRRGPHLHRPQWRRSHRPELPAQRLPRRQRGRRRKRGLAASSDAACPPPAPQVGMMQAAGFLVPPKWV